MAQMSKAEAEFTRRYPYAHVVEEESGVHGMTRYTVYAGDYVCEQALSRCQAFQRSLAAVDRGDLQPDPNERPGAFTGATKHARCCAHCPDALREAGQLVKASKVAEQKALLEETCQSCGRYLVDGEIWELVAHF